MKQVKHKVFAYITNRNRLLVFVHPFAPEAGIQVPADSFHTAYMSNAGMPCTPASINLTRLAQSGLQQTEHNITA